jgi:hypothetical protein
MYFRGLLFGDREAQLYVEGKRTEMLSAATDWYPARNQLLRNLESAGADAKAASMAETAQMLEVHPGLTRPGAPFSRPSSGLLRSCQTYPHFVRGYFLASLRDCASSEFSRTHCRPISHWSQVRCCEHWCGPAATRSCLRSIEEPREGALRV